MYHRDRYRTNDRLRGRRDHNERTQNERPKSRSPRGMRNGVGRYPQSPDRSNSHRHRKDNERFYYNLY